MIYRLTIISLNSHCYTGISDKAHGLTREVDITTLKKLQKIYLHDNN